MFFGGSEMEIVTGYKDDDKLRESFASLAQRTFGLDLLRWYDNGFWQNDYIPYSVILQAESEACKHDFV
jgi:hypothetical protein